MSDPKQDYDAALDKAGEEMMRLVAEVDTLKQENADLHFAVNEWRELVGEIVFGYQNLIASDGSKHIMGGTGSYTAGQWVGGRLESVILGEHGALGMLRKDNSYAT